MLSLPDPGRATERYARWYASPAVAPPRLPASARSFVSTVDTVLNCFEGRITHLPPRADVIHGGAHASGPVVKRRRRPRRGGLERLSLG